MLNLRQHPWPALSSDAALNLFHAKTRRREEIALAAKRLFSFIIATGRAIERPWGLSAQAFFFAPSRLRVKPTGVALSGNIGHGC